MKTACFAHSGVWATGLALALSGASAALVPDADTILYVSGDVDYGLENTATASDKFGKNYSKNDRLVTDGMVGGQVRSGRAGTDVTNGGFLFDTNGGGMSAEFTGASAYCSGDFTFECFLRLSADATIDGSNGYVVRHANAWMLGFFSTNGDLVLYNKSWGVLAKAGIVKDGLWHHVAVVQNRTRGKMALYLDYRLVGEGDYVVPTTDNTPANTFDVNCYNWDGEYNFNGATKKLAMDEIRLVKRALAPAEFVMTPAAASDYDSRFAALTVADGDTLVYVSGNRDPSAVAGVNDLVDFGRPPLPYVSHARLPTAVTSEGLPTVYAGTYVDSTTYTNTTCHRFSANGLNGSAYLRLEDDSFMDDDFTLEFFFGYADAAALIKDASSGSAYLAYFAPLFYISSWDGTKVNFNAGGTSVYTPTRTDDGLWHHYAVTWDKSALTLRMYFDGGLLVTKTFDSMPAHQTGLKKPLYFATGCWNSGYQDVGTGCFDEIRLTQRLLRESEYLTARPYPVGTNTLAYLSFDRDRTATFVPDLASPLACRLKTNVSLATDATSVAAPALYAAATDGQTHANACSLAVDLNGHNNGTKGGGYIFDDPQYKLSTGDFTVETFFKVEDWSDYYGYLFNCKDSWNVYLSNAENPTLGCNVAGQGFRGSVGLLDGVWHHVAVVADSTAETVTVYLDYQVFRRFTGVTDPLKAGSTRPTVFLFGGSSEETYGLVGGPAKCHYDEFRVTKRALLVTEFLTDERLTEANSTPWARFERNWSSGAGRYCPLGEASATGAALTPLARARSKVLDATGTVVAQNACGLKLTGGGVAYAATGALDKECGTIEFFVNGTSGGAADNVFALAPDLDVASPLLQLKADGTFRFGGPSVQLNVALTDGTWHHVAVVYSRTETLMNVKVLWDHAVVHESSVAKPAVTRPLGLVLGGGAFSGEVDELRFRGTVEDASGMLYLGPKTFTRLMID